MAGVEFNPTVREKGGTKAQGAFLAHNNDDEKKPKFTIAFNQPTGYVSPPASNIMGFGPASELS